MSAPPRLMGLSSALPETTSQRAMLDGEGPTGTRKAPRGSWRRLPTAWIHFLLVELRHVYSAMYAWMVLINNITTKVYLADKHLDDPAKEISSHFWDKYFKFYAQQRNVTFNANVPLTLHETRPHGFGIMWLVVGWVLPVGASWLLLYSIVRFARECIWSFESGAYLHFTWNHPRTLTYKYLVGVMATAPMLLLAVWFVGAHCFPRNKDSVEYNFEVMEGSLLTIVVLLFSLNLLAFPSVIVHNWHRGDMLRLKFRRSLFHLFFGSNANFGLKLTDALWTTLFESRVLGHFPEKPALQRYFWSREDAETAFQLCQNAQLDEVQRVQQSGTDSERSRSDEGDGL